MAMVAVAVAAAAVGVYAATRSITIPGQKLGDISPQTSKEGEPRLIVWGIVRPIGGNIVAVQEPPRIERRKQKSGGKGGGPSTTSEHPHRTYAIAICEGPITGIRRVWRNNKLVYDGRPGSEWGAENNPVFLRTARFFLGSFNQMPSSDLEQVFGVGNVPAMRGTAYMVMADEDLSDMGGAVPQWLFEVVRSEGFHVTSRPYAVETYDEHAASLTLDSVGTMWPPKDSHAAGITLTSIEKVRKVAYLTYEGLPENHSASISLTSIEKVRKVAYSTYDSPPEYHAAGITLTSIEKVRTAGYITYEVPADSQGASLTLTAIEKVKV